jgi:hypothetical protein
VQADGSKWRVRGEEKFQVRVQVRETGEFGGVVFELDTQRGRDAKLRRELI